MTRIIFCLAIALTFTVFAHAKAAEIPSKLQGTWVTDIDASQAYMTSNGKAELIESLPFLASTYKYVLDDNTLSTLRKDTEIGRVTVNQVQTSDGDITLVVSGINRKTNETVEFQIIFVAQPDERYLIKLSNSPANDYFVWKNDR